VAFESLERREVELRGRTVNGNNLDAKFAAGAESRRGRTGNGNSAHARFAKEDAKGAVVGS
jgi:hypothetical protein